MHRPLQCAFSLSLLLLAGCAERELSDRRIQAREGGVDNSLRVFGDYELKGEQRLATTFEVAERQLQRDVAVTAAAGERIGGWIDYDVKRWNANQATYRRHIENQIRGKPEAIERSAIWLFW